MLMVHMADLNKRSNRKHGRRMAIRRWKNGARSVLDNPGRIVKEAERLRSGTSLLLQHFVAIKVTGRLKSNLARIGIRSCFSL